MAPKVAAVAKKRKEIVPKGLVETLVFYHADALAVTLTLLILLFGWEVTNPIASKALLPSHNITFYNASAPNPEPALYTAGVFDFAFVLMVASAVLCIHDIGHDWIWEILANRVKAQRTFKAEIWFNGTYFVFRLVCLWWGIGLLTDGHSGFDVWTGYPHAMSVWTKVLCIVNIAYWLQAFPVLAIMTVQLRQLAKVPMRQFSNQRYVEISSNLAWVSLAYMCNFSRLVVLIVTLESVPEILRVVHWIIDLTIQSRPAPKKKWFSTSRVPTLRELRSYLSLALNISQAIVRCGVVGLVVYVFCVVLPFSDSPGKHQNVTDYNNPLVRVLLLVLISFAQFVAVAGDVFSGKVAAAQATPTTPTTAEQPTAADAAVDDVQPKED
eukprot:m.488330 g.488330  ORF g.488330 m.488330 type:complete len:382 (-) comp25716_c0_seq1:301-1446(-)